MKKLRFYRGDPFFPPLDVLDLACGAKKKFFVTFGCSEPRLRCEKKTFTGRIGGIRRVRKCEKSFFAMACEKKNIHGRPENSRELKNAKNHFSQMACEKKNIHGSADLGCAKKKHSRHLSSVACEKKSFTTGLKIVKMRKMLFRTRLESLPSSTLKNF